MEKQGIQSQRLDHLGIVAGICNEIGLIEVLDEQIEDTGRKVSVGQAVQAMILNGLGFVSRPLYLTPEFFHNKPVDLLVGEGLEAQDLNDDCLGRALDKLFGHGVTELFTAVSARAMRVFNLETHYAHLDSTSFGLHGTYESDERQEEGSDDEPVPIEVTYGYSRDHRPDLKQVMVSLICANAGSLPLWFRALDGNSSDQKTFTQTIKAYLKQFTREEEMPVLVADAALYTEANLQDLPQALRWITRVPATLKGVKALYEGIDNEDLFIADEETRYMEVASYYAGVKQRWLLVLHEPSRYKQDESLAKRVKKERQSAEKKLNPMLNKDYGCEDAIHKALRSLTQKWQYHRLNVTIYTEKRYEQVGRPTEDAPYKLVWRVDAQIEQDHEAWARLRLSHGKYVIATNDLDDEKLPLLSMLAIYKEQSSGVERGFRFLKDPIFHADSLFLKKPSRIMALLMVMGLSLLVYALAEHQVRQQLLEKDVTLPDQTGKPTQRPTARRIFQMMEGVDVLIIENQDFRQHLVLNMNEIRWRIVVLFSPHVQKLYDLHL